MKKLKINNLTPVYLLIVLVLSYPVFGLILIALNSLLKVQWTFESPLFYAWDKIVFIGDVLAAILVSRTCSKNIFFRIVLAILFSLIFVFVQTWCFLNGYVLAVSCLALALWFWCVKYYLPKCFRRNHNS